MTTAPALAASRRNGTLDQDWRGALEELVSCNSWYGNTEGTRRMFERLDPYFRELGYACRRLPLAEDHELRVYEWPDGAPVVTCIGHVDTVFAPDSGFEGCTVAETRFHGPGVSDMKAGLVCLIHALQRISDPRILSRVRIVLNDDEDIGAKYSGHTLPEVVGDTRILLVFEPGLKAGAYACACAVVDGEERERLAIQYYERDEFEALKTHLVDYQAALGRGESPLLRQSLPSDARIAREGRVMVVGFGPYGGGTHTPDEFMDVATYEERLHAAVSALSALAAGRTM